MFYLIQDGNTPLHVAALHCECCHVPDLMACGVDPYIKNKVYGLAINYFNKHIVHSFGITITYAVPYAQTLRKNLHLGLNLIIKLLLVLYEVLIMFFFLFNQDGKIAADIARDSKLWLQLYKKYEVG